MFPQYSAATTASIFDKLSEELSKWRNIQISDFCLHIMIIIYILMHVLRK